MKASDFNLSEEISFDFDKGLTTFRNTRLVIFDSNAIGLLRQNLIEALGMERAREFLLRFGFQHGYSDFMQMDMDYNFETDMDRLASGPVMHTWEGIVHAAPGEMDYDRSSGKFLFRGVWSNSYEAEQHLAYNETGDFPVCWTLMGYASGWATGFFSAPLLAIEPKCMGKGDAHCEWLIQPPEVWGDEKKPYVAALQEFWDKIFG
jgi:hypothetical protein